MRCFVGDMNTSLVNVYDVNKEVLIKSINCGETTLSAKLGFNKEETKIYRIGIQYAYIIDVASLEIQKYKLYADEDTAVQNISKLMDMIEAEKNRVLKEGENLDNIANGNLPQFTETVEMKRIKALPMFILTMGVSENGIVVSERIFANKIEINVFDLKQAGKKINRFELPSGSNITMHEGNLLVFTQDGTINIIDPVTANNIGKIENAFEANDLTDARAVTATYDNKDIHPNLSSYGKYLITTISLGTIPNTATTNLAFSIYDFAKKSIIYNYRSTEFLPNIMPIEGTLYFQKVVAKTPMPQLQLPEAPDFTKFNYKDIKNGLMTKASQDYDEKVKTAQADWKIKIDAYNSPQNFATKIYTDINLTQEIFSVDATRFIGLKGDFVICYKDISIEFYDLKTKNLLHTIYF
ncbi:MAG: hypothetical protein WCP57_01635 [Bacteroidota bacterium]